MLSLTCLTSGGVLTPLKNTTNTGHNELLHQDPLQPPLEPRPGITKPPGPNWGRAAVAVALGFEPRVAVTPHSISSAAPSAARTRYLTRILYYTDPRATQIDRAGWEQGHTTPRRADLALTNKHARTWAQLQRARPVLHERKTIGTQKVKAPLIATNNPAPGPRHRTRPRPPALRTAENKMK